jgi:hypothetical protein
VIENAVIVVLVDAKKLERRKNLSKHEFRDSGVE